MKLILFTLIVIILNLPFGYWRSNVKKFSFQWILAIHIPVPVIIFLKLFLDICFVFHAFFIDIIAYMLGQILGQLIYKSLSKKIKVSSCFFIDYYKFARLFF